MAFKRNIYISTANIYFDSFDGPVAYLLILMEVILLYIYCSFGFDEVGLTAADIAGRDCSYYLVLMK